MSPRGGRCAACRRHRPATAASPGGNGRAQDQIIAKRLKGNARVQREKAGSAFIDMDARVDLLSAFGGESSVRRSHIEAGSAKDVGVDAHSTDRGHPFQTDRRQRSGRSRAPAAWCLSDARARSPTVRHHSVRRVIHATPWRRVGNPVPKTNTSALEPRQLKGDLLDLRLAHYGTLQQISNSRIPIREMA